jgi:MFS family permease
VAGGLGPRYWKLWSSSAVANLADGIFQVAIALLAVRLTRSPLLIAGVAVTARLPWLLLALPAGAWADRWDRRLTMVRMNAIRVALLAALSAAIAADVATIGLVYAITFGLGCAEVLFDTSAQTLMPAVVESKDDLSKANGRLYAAETVLNQFVGPPLGGVLIGLSVAAAIGSSAGLYAVAVVGLALLPGAYRSTRTAPASGPTTLRTEIAEGLRYLFAHRLLRTLALLLGAMNLWSTAQFSIFVLFAVTKGDRGLGLSDTGVGLLLTVGAIGAVLGSLVAAPVERALGRARVLLLSMLVGSAAMAAPGVWPTVAVAAASGAAFGISGVLWNVITVSLRQRIIPDHLLGRVNSCYRLLGWGSIPIGGAVGGVLAELFGLRAVFLIAGAGQVVLIPALVRVVTDRAIVAAEESPPPQPVR